MAGAFYNMVSYLQGMVSGTDGALLIHSRVVGTQAQKSTAEAVQRAGAGERERPRQPQERGRRRQPRAEFPGLHPKKAA